MNAATSTSVRSFPCIDDLRFKATKEADAAPVMMIIVHRTDSTETKYIYKTAAAGYNTKHRGTSKAMLPENATALVNYVLVRTLRNMVHYCSKTGLGPIKLTGFNSTSGMNLQFQTLEKIKMPQGDDGLAKPTASSYDEAMDALSSLITKRSRADKSNKGDRFDFLFDYVKMLDLEEPISKMSVIHVAGTKGKEKTSDDMPMPTYFRFLALLAFKIFSAEQVDVAILEVGLGGRFDATNVVQTPVVCGISSLGYDHMEILGNTLGEIAGEKAGIFKQGVPAFTVPQPEEAMCVLEEKASQLNVPVKVAPALDTKLLNGLNLGLHGEHQYLNAGLAIALCSTWLQRTGHIEVNNLEQNNSLPEHFIKGLTMATLQGRAQIVPDRFIDIESPGDLVFYLDGAHSPESMEVCAKWFSLAIKEGNKQELRNNQQDDFGYGGETPRMNSTQVGA
ncbi:hypothetical protein RHMOL_Rhmol03G0155300 [Rhododendron molle]|uniref:Uncharacterized protein n=1 Tax=Rhododendron molle TaxID=49168 RepID=A0ACC0PH91_RHOML|nr:hypothetical protein RHMOL_Rhmol03G0155300 [Rhododendron molle]